MRISHWPLVVGGLAIAGCGGGDERAEGDDAVGMMGHMDSARMDMGGMPMQGMQIMPQMRAHMDSMMRMSPQQMQAMMARHQSLMSQMVDGMGADMRGMKMSVTRAGPRRPSQAASRDAREYDGKVAN